LCFAWLNSGVAVVKERIVVEDLNLDARKEPSCHVILEKRKVETKRSHGNQ
jgi:hypothetical protein